MFVDWFNQPNWMSAAGIIWDLSGAYALARGWLFTTNDRMKRQSGSYYGANPAAGRAYAEQRLDTRLGFTHLLVGFSLQLLAAVGFAPPLNAAMLALAPLFIHWLMFVSTYLDNVVADGVRASIVPSAAESTWRAHYSDVSELVWRRALMNAGIEFVHKVPPGTL